LIIAGCTVHVKIIDAQLARLCNSYKNTKLKLLQQMLQYGLIKCAKLNIWNQTTSTSKSMARSYKTRRPQHMRSITEGAIV